MTTGKKTRGAELLAKVPESSREIAEHLEVSAGLVGAWKTGTRRPTKTDQARIAAKWPRVPVESWSERPKKTGLRRKQAAPKAARGAASDAPPPPTTPADDSKEDNTARLHRYIREGLRELEADTELSGVKRAEALKKLVDARCALDRSTGENALTMSRILEHPQFKDAVRVITDAISPFPEALAAAIKALEAVVEKARRR